jgi:CYTH domain-containing protein
VLRAGEWRSVNSRELNMVTSRRYLIASSLARLIRKERGGNRVTEGHFPNQADRSSFVVVEGDKGSLVLLHTGPNGPSEERTEVPRAHAEALLDVTPGKLDYLLTHLTVGTRDIQIVRFVTPGPLDLIAVPFESDEEARDFRPLSWFGPDVTTEVAYQNRSIALEGAPQAPDVPMSNAALNSLLDTLENRYSAPRGYTPHAPARGSAEDGAGQRNAPPPTPAQANERTAQPQRGVLSRPAAPVDADLGDDDAGDDNDLNLNIEDNVIRELARSLRPQRR